MLEERRAGTGSGSFSSLTRKRLESPRLHSCRSIRPCTVLVTVVAPYAIEYELTRKIRKESVVSNLKL
jgi:uncharacterized membrane protein